MKITLQFEAQLRRAAGVASLTMDVAEAASLSEAIRGASEQLPVELTRQILESDGTIRRSLLCFVNQKPVSSEQQRTQSLQEGDCVLLCPPISGG